MAYRTFKNESYYEAPEIGKLPQTNAAMDTLLRIRAQKAQRRANLENDWKTFIADNKLPSVNRKINEGGREVTNSVINAYKAGYDTLPASIRVKQAELQGLDKEAIAQEETMKRLHEAIQQKRLEDPYYKPAYDEERLKSLALDNDLPLREDLDQRSKALTEINNTMGKDVRNSFNRDLAASDYVTKRGKVDVESDVTDASGVRSKIHTIAKFRDKDGKPGITDDHVNEYFDKDPRLYESYYHDAVDQVAKEWDAFKATGKPLPPWAKGLKDQDVVATLVNEPDKAVDIGQPVKSTWGRISELAKRDLKKYEDVSVNSLRDVSDQNPGHVYGLTSDKFNAPADGFNAGTFSGPSRTITLKGSPTSPYMTIDSRSKARLNPATGEVSYSQLPRKFTLNNYQWVPYKVDDRGNKIPFPIDAKDEQDLIQKLNALPDEAFDSKRGGIAGAAPALNGYSIDKANIMNLAYAKKDELEEKVASNPTDDAAKAQLDGVKQVLETINADGDFNGQLVQKYLGVDVMNNEMFIPDHRDANVKDIESRTGMDIFSDKSLNPEMRKVKQAIETRAKQAQVNLAKKEAATIQQKEQRMKAVEETQKKKVEAAKAQLPKVSTQAQYDALKPGDQYIDPKGVTRTKG